MNKNIRFPYERAVALTTIDTSTAFQAFIARDDNDVFYLFTKMLKQKRANRAALAPQELAELPPLIDFAGYDFSITEFIGMNPGFSDFDCSGINFSGANLSGTNLSGSRFFGAVFTGANLFRTNFTDANMTGAILAGAIHTGQAIWLDPAGSDLDPVLKGAEAGRGLGGRGRAARPGAARRAPV